jgi:hypothetical protein
MLKIGIKYFLIKILYKCNIYKIKMRLITGYGLHPQELKAFLNESYVEPSQRQNDIFGYFRDETIGGNYGAVYFNPEKNEAVVVHRGTDVTLGDWKNNLIYADNLNNYVRTERFKIAKNIQDKAERKYGAENIITIGHSQGGLLANLLGEDTKETIIFNPAMKLEKTRPNMTIVRSDKDVVSAVVPIRNTYHRTLGRILHPGKSRNALKNSANNVTIKNDSWFDVVNNHDMGILDKLDNNEKIGKGINKTKRGQRNEGWMDLVKRVQRENNITFKEAMIEAKKVYKK